MARTMAPKTLETGPESDRFEDTRIRARPSVSSVTPRWKAVWLRSSLSGHLPQAFIVGGPPGVGKATLAWRLARFLLANPDPSAAGGEARARNTLWPPIIRSLVKSARWRTPISFSCAASGTKRTKGSLRKSGSRMSAAPSTCFSRRRGGAATGSASSIAPRTSTRPAQMRF